MGYAGRSNYEERDRLFERSFQEKGANRNQVKKDLEALFKPKSASAPAATLGAASPTSPLTTAQATPVAPAPEKPQVNLCALNHAWIRDWDGVYKCVRCKMLKPVAPKAGAAA